jgi:hypothetical protein
MRERNKFAAFASGVACRLRKLLEAILPLFLNFRTEVVIVRAWSALVFDAARQQLPSTRLATMTR